MAAIGELVRSTSGQWMARPPLRCRRGHTLRPGRMLVGERRLFVRPASDLALRMWRSHLRAGAGRRVQSTQWPCARSLVAPIRMPLPSKLFQSIGEALRTAR
jgi:hypothetical protein